jgi:5-dehydro-2-deoxygluconokinase
MGGRRSQLLAGKHAFPGELKQQFSETVAAMKNSTRFASGRKLDVICLGRLAVDLYAQQIGARLEDVSTFSKYLGGSSGNIACNCARLGLKSAMLTRVGDDHMGRSLIETLAREGCDVSHVVKDENRLTALVLLGLKDRETFPLVFYRENCADMALDASDFDEAFIASSKALLITGTHFSTAQVDKASRQALEYARRNGVRTILDIDYRPVLWGLTAKAEGEVRYVSCEGVTKHLQGILPLFDLVVGTIEEFEIAKRLWSSSAGSSVARSSKVKFLPLLMRHRLLPAFRLKCSMCSGPVTPLCPVF